MSEPPPPSFNKATLPRKSKKRVDIEATAKANPTALSARRQCVIVTSEVEPNPGDLGRGHVDE